MNYTKYLRQLSWILGLLLAANAVSMGLFVYKPALFYFRPWEYFPEVAYRFARYEAAWDAEEKSDQTRSNIFYHQESRRTHVSVDPDGFRTNFLPSTAYRILVAGDSAVFGSGLSDDETLPWRLAERLDIPVFNGGRTSMYNALKRADVADVELILDVRTEREVRGDVFNDYGLGRDDPYTPQMTNHLPAYRLPLEVPAPRYLLTSIALRTISRAINDLRVLATGGPKPYLFHRHTFRPEDLRPAVEAIVRRSEEVRAQGKDYVFVAIPAKQTLYSKQVDPYTRDYLHALTAALEDRGVDTIELLDDFRDNAEMGLYHRYDSHWNGNGTSVAADAIARALRERFGY
ncbi:MAG: hypothetical protein L6Q83_04315 [Gammaproteobacteria bacterium]|nr:hypothetical protein [Gammaproteobacteria bacterium]